MCCQEKSYCYTLHKNWIKFFRNHIVFLVHFETWNPSGLLSLSWCHSLYHSQSLAVTHYHFLLLIVSRCHSLSFVVIRWTTRCRSLPFVVPLVVIDCHSLCHSLSLAVIRCTTRLYFYKRLHFYKLKSCVTAFGLLVH